MNRAWISVLAGIALLSQSLSMAWASTGHTAAQAAATVEQAMPCHGGDSGPGTAPDCCNGDCIFMCGGAPLPAGIQLVAAEPPEHAFPAVPVPALHASHTLSPFRPPAL